MGEQLGKTKNWSAPPIDILNAAVYLDNSTLWKWVLNLKWIGSQISLFAIIFCTFPEGWAFICSHFLSLFSPHCSILANIPGTDLYRNRKDYLQVSVLNENKYLIKIKVEWFHSTLHSFSDVWTKRDKNLPGTFTYLLCQCWFLQEEDDRSCMYGTYTVLPSTVAIFLLFSWNKSRMMSKNVFQVGFNPLRVLQKRNKAIKKIKKMLQEKDQDIKEVGLLHKSITPSTCKILDLLLFSLCILDYS